MYISKIINEYITKFLIIFTYMFLNLIQKKLYFANSCCFFIRAIQSKWYNLENKSTPSKIWN